MSNLLSAGGKKDKKNTSQKASADGQRGVVGGGEAGRPQGRAPDVLEGLQSFSDASSLEYSNLQGGEHRAAGREHKRLLAAREKIDALWPPSPTALLGVGGSSLVQEPRLSLVIPKSSREVRKQWLSPMRPDCEGERVSRGERVLLPSKVAVSRQSSQRSPEEPAAVFRNALAHAGGEGRY
ncbi:hypothetical protein EI94DRAFT_1701491 [Lactarius quietus]|nr:hypothetical protein EI94DRAFT_1701491 [Lactarius quietus]